MKISTMLSYAGGFRQSAAQVAELEQAGLDLVWVAEAYGLDSPSLMGYLAALTERVEIGSAILPIYTRTPTLIAMTAAGIDALSDGRFHLGLGASGPQVIEGWHGVPYTAPLGRTREIIEICRQVWAREAHSTHTGRHYTMPLPADQGTGLGKALKIIAHPVRPAIPVWVASLGEKNVAHDRRGGQRLDPHAVHPREGQGRVGFGPGCRCRTGATRPSGPCRSPLAASWPSARVRTSPPSGSWPGPRWPSTSAAWVPRGGTSTTTSPGGTATRRPPRPSRTSTSTARRPRRRQLVPDELLELLSLCGPESYVADRIAAFAEAGVTHLQVAPVPVGDQRAVDLIETVKRLAG